MHPSRADRVLRQKGGPYMHNAFRTVDQAVIKKKVSDITLSSIPFIYPKREGLLGTKHVTSH